MVGLNETLNPEIYVQKNILTLKTLPDSCITNSVNIYWELGGWGPTRVLYQLGLGRSYVKDRNNTSVSVSLTIHIH